MSPPTKSYVWVFTAFPPPSTSTPTNPMLDWARFDQVKLAVCQCESCPDTGRRHYQGAIRFRARLTLTAAKAACDELGLPGCHLEIMRGRFDHSISYCTKPDTRVSGPWYFPDQAACHAADSLELDRSGSEASLQSFEDLPPRWRFITCCWGPPAIGKSYIWSIIGAYIGGGVYKVPAKAKNSNGRWIGDYKGEQTAIIDEYDFDNDFEESQWKLILDRRPQVVPGTMGGKSVLWCPQVIVLLSNNPIGPGHPFTSMVFRTRFSEIFNDWNWIYTAVGQRFPRLPNPFHNPPVELHGTIDLYPRYVPPSDRVRSRKRKASSPDSGAANRNQPDISFSQLDIGRSTEPSPLDRPPSFSQDVIDLTQSLV